jgi:heme-degrading monooxygenase HmoA
VASAPAPLALPGMRGVGEPECRETALVKTVLSMVVRPGCEPVFESAWATLAPSISCYPGNLGQALMRDAQERRRYVIVSDWSSFEALRAFETSDERRRLSTALDPLRESADKNVFDVIADIVGGPGSVS